MTAKLGDVGQRIVGAFTAGGWEVGTARGVALLGSLVNGEPVWPRTVTS